MGDYVVVPDRRAGGTLVSPAEGIVPQYVLVVDGRPDPITVTHQVGPVSGLVLLLQGRRGGPGPTGMSAYELAVQEGFEGTLEEYLQTLRGFILLPPGVDIPPAGTPDGTFVWQEV